MWKRYTGILSLSLAILLVAAAFSTPSIDASAEQPTGGPVSAEGEMSGQMVHADTDDVVDVELADFAINAAEHAFTPGESVEFRVVNTGVVAHEFRLSNQTRVDEHVAAGHEGHEGATPEEMAAMGMDEASTEGGEHAEAPGAVAGDHEEAPEAEDALLFLEPGESGTLVFHFPEIGGDYTVAVCVVPGTTKLAWQPAYPSPPETEWLNDSRNTREVLTCTTRYRRAPWSLRTPETSTT